MKAVEDVAIGGQLEVQHVSMAFIIYLEGYRVV